MDGDFSANFIRNTTALSQNPALVLNADYRPLSYLPVSLWSWQDAIKAAYLDRV
ncbi:MAG: HNH endonuclease, partial [Rhodobacterales bacterium]